ncbi:MAG: ANTAR domain-containing protein [Clostridia bacterium]|nr:ANTAR domain-containing protein [Clostridia bacterium]
MSLKERTYSILIVSASDRITEALSEVFPLAVFSPVNTVSNVSAAKRAISERDFDIVVVNPPLPDDSLRFAVDTVDTSGSVLLYLARAEQYANVYDLLAEHGVFVVQKPVPMSVLRTVSGWLISARERLRRSEKKTLSIEEKMNEIRLSNRAKLLLISELKMTEADAHRYIEKQAMDRCVSKRVISEEIIKTYG